MKIPGKKKKFRFLGRFRNIPSFSKFRRNIPEFRLLVIPPTFHFLGGWQQNIYFGTGLTQMGDDQPLKIQRFTVLFFSLSYQMQCKQICIK